jgi:RNA polymerase sigma-70 factor (ECF subfamily)
MLTDWNRRSRRSHEPGTVVVGNIKPIQETADQALRDAVEAHGSFVYGVARRILVDPDLAEEVTQDTFLTLWKSGRFDPARGKLRAYLCTVARNKAIDLVRREEAQRRVWSAAAEAPVPEPVDAFDGWDDRATLVDALKKLTGLQREALMLAYFGGHTYKEVAAELRIPEGTAKTRLRDGLTALRELLTIEPFEPLGT